MLLTWRWTILLALLPILAFGSLGDHLPEYQRCVIECESVVCSAKSTSNKFSSHSVNPLSRILFGWDCYLDCGYKCQQLITSERINNGEEVVQFYGKWPFLRVWGITEPFSTLFSIGNFYVNYRNGVKLRKAMKTNANFPHKTTMLKQFFILVLFNLFGWACSTIFHIRDTSFTESMDYFGAGCIVMANFNAVFVRFFDLHLYKNKERLLLFQFGLIVVLLIHYVRLFHSWDYGYNMTFNVVVGLLAAAFWIGHSIRVYINCKSGNFATRSIYLAPFESIVAKKLQMIGISNTAVIPLIPVALNLFLILSVMLELVDFVPWFLLIDAHSLWHLCTIFPPMIWHDWNIWELELSSMDSRLP